MSKTTSKADVQAQLRQAIADNGQSLNELGKAAGIDSGRLSRFMRGERDLTLAAASRLCAVLDLRLVRSTEANGQSAAAPEKTTKKQKGK